MAENYSGSTSDSNATSIEGSESVRWNPEGLMQRIYNNNDLFSALLNSFLNDSPKHTEDLNNAAKNLDQSTLKTVSHLLKGVCGQLCADKLHRICVEIEQVSLAPVDQVDKQHLDTLCLSFNDEIALLENLFREALSEPEAEEAPAGDSTSPDELISQLSQLQERLDQSDYIDPDSLSSLKGACGQDQELKNLVQRLIEEINLFDNAAASATLKEILALIQPS